MNARYDRTIPLTRRGLLAGATGIAAAGALGLAGCSSYHEKVSASINIPKPVTRLPKGNVTFRLMDSDDTKKPFWNQFFAAYQQAHGNIACTYDGLPWVKIDEVLPLGIRNGTAHDVFQLDTPMVNQAIEDGWVTPLDEVMPDFQTWQASFPADLFHEGAQVFDGKLYTVPLTSDQRDQVALHYNKELLDKAGYDPQSTRLTWDEYRAAARKITKQGNGRAYGVVLEIGQTGRLERLVDSLARVSGATVSSNAAAAGIDLHTGEYYYTSDEARAAIELLLALKKDGSLFPGSNSLTAPQAWPRVVRGNAGMVAAGPWVTVEWETDEPDFEFGVGALPAPDRNPTPMGYPVASTADALWVYAKSKRHDVAADVLHYVTSLDGQKAWGKIVGVGNPPILPEALAEAEKSYSTQARKALALGKALKADPDPTIGNPDVSVALRMKKPLTPTWGEVIQGILVGKTTDVRKALTDLKDRAERSLDDAITAAKAKGAKVSRDDWTFRNWDPSADYTSADYRSR